MVGSQILEDHPQGEVEIKVQNHWEGTSQGLPSFMNGVPMRTFTRFSLLGLLMSGPLLQAQRPNLGITFNFGIPAGGYRRTDWPATPASGPVHQDNHTGFGAQFNASFPIRSEVAIRASIGGMTATATQWEDAYGRRGLRHNLLELGGELQLFLDGGALQHRGTYLFIGPSIDFENWSYTYSRYWTTSTYTYARKSRPAATMGFGHSFPLRTGRFTFEMGYHKTLSGADVSSGEPANTDFMKIGFGWVF